MTMLSPLEEVARFKTGLLSYGQLSVAAKELLKNEYMEQGVDLCQPLSYEPPALLWKAVKTYWQWPNA